MSSGHGAGCLVCGHGQWPPEVGQRRAECAARGRRDMERESHAFLIIIILVKRGQGFRQDIRLGGDGGLGSRSLEVTVLLHLN